MNHTSKCGRRSLPVSQWPEADQAGWRRALQPQDFFDNTIGYASRWKPSTRTLTEMGYGHWIDWLTQTGQVTGEDDPAGRVTRNRVRAYQQGMEADDLAPFTVAGRLQQLGNALRAIAPAGDWVWVLRGASRLRSRATPAKDKRDGMQPAEDVQKLGFDLMQAADHDRFRTKVDRAILFRDGLLLSMFVSRSLRRANVTSIEIDQHLRRRGNVWWLSFEAAEMKGPRPFACSVPEELTSYVERYIEGHRPVLMQTTRRALKPTNALWISKQGTTMTSCAIMLQVKQRTRDEFGTPINPHKFRHIYATEIATVTPDHAGDIQLGLGHTGPKTAEKHYNLAKMIDAGRKYEETLAKLRKEAGIRTSAKPADPSSKLDPWIDADE